MRDPLKHRSANKRANPLFLACIDSLAWLLAIFAGLLLRFDFEISRVHPPNTALVSAIVVVFQMLFGYALWLYRSRYKTGSFDEVRALVVTVTAVLLPSWLIAFWIVDRLRRGHSPHRANYRCANRFQCYGICPFFLADHLRKKAQAW